MILEFADIAVFKLLQMCLMGCVVYFASNAASTRHAEAIKAKKKTTVRGKSKRREAVKIRKVKGRKVPSKAKAISARPLSIEDQRRVDAYRIGRDWPGFKTSSQVPL